MSNVMKNATYTAKSRNTNSDKTTTYHTSGNATFKRETVLSEVVSAVG
jgi:hypothetical protein